MKLLYITNARIPTEKAHGVQIMKMCEAFVAAGNDVTLVVPRRFNQIKDDPFDYYGVKPSFSIRYIPTLDFVHLGKWGFVIQELSFAFSSALYSLFRGKGRVIYSRDEYVLLLVHLFRSRTFLEVHVKKVKPAFVRVARRCKGVVTISKGLRDHVGQLGIGRENILVAHDAVDLDDFAQDGGGIDEGKNIIAYVGKYKTMGQEKGVSEILRMFPGMQKTIPSAHLLLVGLNEDEFDEVTALLQSLNVSEDAYTLIGHVPQREALHHMQLARVLIMNYPSSDHYAHYMSPLKLFEYMGSQRPIVAPRLPSLIEVLDEDDAYLFEPDDREDMLAKVLEALHDDDQKHKALRAYEKVQEYTWKKRAEAITSFMKKRYE